MHTPGRPKARAKNRSRVTFKFHRADPTLFFPLPISRIFSLLIPLFSNALSPRQTKISPHSNFPPKHQNDPSPPSQKPMIETVRKNQNLITHRSRASFCCYVSPLRRIVSFFFTLCFCYVLFDDRSKHY
jgi:hypothetical protein